MAWNQLELPWEFKETPKVTSGQIEEINLAETTSSIAITGKNFEYGFDKNSGNLTSMKFMGKELLQKGPSLYVLALSC